MIHLPVLRHGKPYRSLTRNTLTHLGTGEPVAEVSVANAGLIARDLSAELGGQEKARRALEGFSTRELIDLCRRAGELFLEGTLPVETRDGGEQEQTPDDYVRQLSATTGLPEGMARGNMGKIHYVLDQMETVLGGLTRGLDLRVLEDGYGVQDGRIVSYRREADTLGAVLPSNSPGVHSLWLPAIPLKVGLALKPGRQEPWTPYRVCQAFLAAGCPPEALGFYPADYAGAGEILQRCGRSLLFGDRSTVGSWAGDPRIQLHGPGWSKVVFGPDKVGELEALIPVAAASVADNGGRSCINASGVWAPSRGREIAEALARELAKIEARGLTDPEARLAAFPSVEAAHRLSEYIDNRIAAGGAEDVTARARAEAGGPASRVQEVDGCAFLLPTVVYCESPDHPLAEAEFLFPFVTVVEAPAGELLSRMGESLVVTALSDDPAFLRDVLASGNVERLNVGPIPTSRVTWDQPHEGNLFEHLYRQRAFQAPHVGSEAAARSAAPV